MSESDDTDILLLIPPDLFTVASSSSEESLSTARYKNPENSAIDGLLEQVQLLEDRLSAIESKESPFKAPRLDRSADAFEMFKTPASRATPRYPSPLRHFSSSNSTSDSPEKREKEMYSKYYVPTSSNSRSDNLDPFSPLNYRHKNSYDGNSSTLPTLDLKSETKEVISNDFSLLLNNSSSGNSVIDRFSERKSPMKPDVPRKIRDLSKIQENYSKLSSTSSELNSLNSRNFNFSADFARPKRTEAGVNTDPTEFKSQKLLSLSDFWEPDGSRSDLEKLRIKLEEEKFRREHCEKTIQDLQKRLLEQQEKVAVAIGIDKEKNSIILQYQSLTQKLKNQFQVLQNSQKKLEDSFAESKAKHREEVEDLRGTVKRLEEDLSTSRKLSQEYREKIDAATEEKLQLLATHANELDNYKSFVRTAEERYELLKLDYDKLMEKNKQLEESSSSLQQDLYRERLKAGEIRSEMAMIHKALDTCEAELTVLRQEKENLQLKLKEEESRSAILERKNVALTEELASAKKAEDLKKEELEKLTEEQEQMKTKLREIYQNQVDEVVKVKVKEFQGQLDAAEAAFKTELDAKQRAIAECAAGKIKSMIDKHQLEINLLEEKHREEKRLYELKLSQNLKRTSVLEAKLGAQQEAKSRIAEQLHCLMEKQWKQAVQIISSGNDASFQSTDTSREIRSLMKSNGGDESSYMEPVKLKMAPKNFFYSHQEHDESLIAFTNNEESQEKIRGSKEDLRKYIKMILQMQESKNFSGTNESSVSSTECRQVPRKYYTKADTGSGSEKTVTWQNTEPTDVHNGVTNIETRAALKPPWK